MSISPPRASKRDHTVRDMLNSAALVLIDLDGCLAFGNDPHPAAPALLERLGSRYAVLSNNSTQTPASTSGIKRKPWSAAPP